MSTEQSPFVCKPFDCLEHTSAPDGPDHPNPLPDRDQTHTVLLLLIRAIKIAHFYHFGVDVWFRMTFVNSSNRVYTSVVFVFRFHGKLQWKSPSFYHRSNELSRFMHSDFEISSEFKVSLALISLIILKSMPHQLS